MGNQWYLSSIVSGIIWMFYICSGTISFPFYFVVAVKWESTNRFIGYRPTHEYIQFRFVVGYKLYLSNYGHLSWFCCENLNHMHSQLYIALTLLW